MRRTPGGEPDDDGNTLSIGWAPGSELPRFDISATGMRRVGADLDAPEIEVSEVEDEEPTLIHDRLPAAGLPPTPSLPPVTAPPQRPGSRVERDSSQFAVSAHAFAMQQARGRKSPRPPPPHVRPVFDSMEEPSYPAPPPPAPSVPAAQPPPARLSQPMSFAAPLPRAQLLPQSDRYPAITSVPHAAPIAPLAHPPADLVAALPAARPSPPMRSAPPPRPSAPAPPSRPAPAAFPTPVPPPVRQRAEAVTVNARPEYAPRVEIAPEVQPRPPRDEEPPASRSPFQRSQMDERSRSVPSYLVPRRQRRSASPIAGRTGAILGAISLLVTIALGVWFLRPHNGELRIAVFSKSGQIDRAEVYVDGEKRCDVAPCVVSDLAPGARQVQVIAPGYPPTTQTEVVEPGKQRLALVSFVSGAAGAQPAGAAALPTEPVTATLEASGKSSVRAIVDGVDRGSLPIKLKDLAPGSHKLKFDGGDRFEALERTVDIAAGRSMDLGAVHLKLVKGRARVEVASTATRVTIEQGGSEHILNGPWPMTIEIDATKPAKLFAKRSGYQSLEIPLTFNDDESERTFRVELEPLRGGGGRAIARERSEPAQRSERSGDDAPASASGQGSLNINSLPSSKVLVDGTPIGSTPKVGYEVAAGTHTVTFIHPELGRKSVTVTVRAGGQATAAVKFKTSDD
jgi:serine/threonine-protein kinase